MRPPVRAPPGLGPKPHGPSRPPCAHCPRSGDWRWIARVERRVPPSWELGDEAISAGCRGLPFPSTRHPGGTNLVVFNANLTAADRLAVHDPNGRLPRDQSSWPPV